MSEKFSDQDAAVIRLLWTMGYKQHRIASLFDCTQGRITEIVTGQKAPPQKKGRRLEVVE